MVSTFAGVRPVVGTGAADPSRESRDHVVWEEEGLLTVTGGELTTFRLIARDALRVVAAAARDELEAVPGTAVRWAEQRWAARAEGVVHLDDLLLRRARIGLLLPGGARALLPRVRTVCQGELGWSDGRSEAEETASLALWRAGYAPEPAAAAIPA